MERGYVRKIILSVMYPGPKTYSGKVLSSFNNNPLLISNSQKFVYLAGRILFTPYHLVGVH